MPESEGSNLDCNTGESGTISPYGGRSSDHRAARNRAAKGYVSSPTTGDKDPQTHTNTDARSDALFHHDMANLIDSNTRARNKN